ncbi:MAG: DEAD/DEAH box helicase, partial [Planctomycetota bacterium]
MECETEVAPVQFSDLPLGEEVQQAIAKSGYEQPTAIQAEIIPHLLFGRDVVAQSQTGTGKTAAFALPILTRIETECREPQVLVLVPTRELAIQVASSFENYGEFLEGFQHATIYGGQDYEIQYRQLRKGPQVVVGTPGRVIDHIKNGKLDISEIECLVLDEADEMLNMGFLEDVQFVLDHAPDERQIALFSATLPAPIRKISEQYLTDPAKVTIKRKTLTADSIRQRAVFVSPRDRVETLIRFLEAEDADGAIVFTRTRETTSLVADKLVRAGLRAIALNGEMVQKARERTIEKLKSGQLDILVATDIAARGLDVSRISHVFNYDLPEGPEAYTHRIGRTGRAGKKGEAVIFVTRSQQRKLQFIEKITRQKIEIVDPPTADEINKMRVKRFYSDIDKTIAN